MVSDQVLKLVHESETVSSVWAKDPSRAPSDIIKQLYGEFKRDRNCDGSEHRQPPSQEAQEAALRCGNWGSTKPSSLFLQAFADALNCLGPDPLSGVVSPPLMGSHGTMPLTVIAPVADVIRHCSNLIARAEREVFFITCAWSPSVAQRLLRNSLIELSRRSVARGQRVTVNLMYDSAGPSNIPDSHHRVKPENYTSKSVGLPGPDEIPNVDLEVTSLHTIPLGTLHAKFCVVDRKIAAVMSNNMQDNDNLEMMVHLEGPIVDSIHDTALITWYRNLRTSVPSQNQVPASAGGLPTNDHERLYLDRSPGQTTSNIALAGESQTQLLPHTTDDPLYDKDLTGEIMRIQHTYSVKPNESRLQAANRQLNIPVKNPIEPTGPEIVDGEEMTPYISTTTPTSVPMAMVSRPPYGCFGSSNGYVPQNEAWLSLIRNAREKIFIQTPDLNAEPLLPALVEALKRGVQVTYYVCFGYNDMGEMIPGQGGTNDQVSKSLVDSLPPDGPERSLLRIYNYVGKDQDHPIHHSFKARSCHIKLLIVDGSVGIQGSGNQDTQSWFHSQEVNVMVDSKEICADWMKGIDRNQNTSLFGRVAKDGIWRDKDGNPGAGYMGDPGKVEGLFKGVVGMVQKMEGLGGF
ncbi:phospholipase D Active site motif protein [Pochonia chlamydosporia 170]|uniref:Phospholipase D Active site motif protein n=1 Tax=Pochonia chlamydosporia 170 TaxID=1380566 RepID=A0A179F0U9_METCM|nr:phospholipase D Active site motif protein [Pochonia chlamydosporia 170]OAQ58870.1 phospholipase D Active site motif protein [Pochonia chlamydosporia 170]